MIPPRRPPGAAEEGRSIARVPTVPATRGAPLPTLAVAAALALLAAPAAAHTGLRSTTPAAGARLTAAPAAVTATYGDALGRVERARVTVDGRPAAAATARLSPADARRLVIPLAPGSPAGAYRVTWTVLGADGHALAGELAFSVRPPAIAMAAARVGTAALRAGRAVAASAGAGR